MTTTTTTLGGACGTEGACRGEEGRQIDVPQGSGTIIVDLRISINR
jgi:hypothetical protein